MYRWLFVSKDKKESYMVDAKEEVVPGLTDADVRKIAEQVFNRTDGNHPQSGKPGSGFIDILQNGKSDISASSVFVRKAILYPH